MTILFLLIAFGAYLVYLYNALVKLKIRVKEAWSDIEVQMKRRYNLIPNLVETVKGYAKHEGDTLERVIEARNQAINTTGTPAEQAVSENMLAGALKSLFALSESYPDLKANQNYLELQQELVDTEDKIQAARRFYNTNVMELNTKVEQFPSNLVANMFHFEAKDFFELEEIDAKQPVKVNFQNKPQESNSSSKRPSPEPKRIASEETKAEDSGSTSQTDDPSSEEKK